MSAEKELKSVFNELSSNLNYKGLTITEETFSDKIVLTVTISDDSSFTFEMSFDKNLESIPSKKFYGFRQEAYVQLMGMLCENYIRSQIKQIKDKA